MTDVMLCYCLSVLNFLNNTIDVEKWILKERNGCHFRGIGRGYINGHALSKLYP